MTPTHEGLAVLTTRLEELRAELADHVEGGALSELCRWSGEGASHRGGVPEALGRLGEIKQAFVPPNLFSHGIDQANGNESSREVDL